MDLAAKNSENGNIDTSQCQVNALNQEVAECLSAEEVFIFCPYVLHFGHKRFCTHPALVRSANGKTDNPKRGQLKS